MDKNIIVEFELAADVKEFISLSSDVSFKDKTIKDFIFSVEDSTLLKIEKMINSPTNIVSAEIVDEKFIAENLPKK